MSASNARAFKYHTGLLKVITCNLRGSPYRRNLGVMIFNGRSIWYLRVLQIFSHTHTFLKVSIDMIYRPSEKTTGSRFMVIHNRLKLKMTLKGL